MKRASSLCRALVALVAIAGNAPDARADTPPSIWDRAKDPSLSESYRLHVEVERRLALSGGRFEDGAGIQDGQARAVRTLLERYNAAESKDARLRFDLGHVYLYLDDYARAQKAYESALAEFPDHPGAERAWSDLADACGHIGDHECERKAYKKTLARATEDVERARPTLNLAETEMHFGNLREAIAGYREALRISGLFPSNELAPLAEWGLAIALDRSGDRPGAEREARFAFDLQRSMGMPDLLRDDKHVYFTPAWEIHWYEGLGAAARARQATTPFETLRLWRAAEQSFTNYVHFGEPAKDRWVELAKLRLAAVKAEREKAEQKYGKTPAREPEDEERELTP